MRYQSFVLRCRQSATDNSPIKIWRVRCFGPIAYRRTPPTTALSTLYSTAAVFLIVPLPFSERKENAGFRVIPTAEVGPGALAHVVCIITPHPQILNLH